MINLIIFYSDIAEKLYLQSLFLKNYELGVMFLPICDLLSIYLVTIFKDTSQKILPSVLMVNVLYFF